jgi:hypothetical protein
MFLKCIYVFNFTFFAFPISGKIKDLVSKPGPFLWLRKIKQATEERDPIPLTRDGHKFFSSYIKSHCVLFTTSNWWNVKCWWKYVQIETAGIMKVNLGEEEGTLHLHLGTLSRGAMSPFELIWRTVIGTIGALLDSCTSVMISLDLKVHSEKYIGFQKRKSPHNISGY